ncbi:MAG TPA: hypothetical protein VGQ99_04235 [Tepidisphaeraceae bacterium]|jgi:hypothetical protein|nr:hypothetical protein [Tepidisphaeraceae bacterium]
MDWLKTILSDHTFLFFFAVVGIPMITISLTKIVKLLIIHRERMAMIEHGMDPDAHGGRPRPVETPPAAHATVADLSE